MPRVQMSARIRKQDFDDFFYVVMPLLSNCTCTAVVAATHNYFLIWERLRISSPAGTDRAATKFGIGCQWLERCAPGNAARSDTAAHIAVMAPVKAPQAGCRRIMHTCGVSALPNLGRLLGRSCILDTRLVLARRPSRQFGYGVIVAQTAVRLKATVEGGSQSYSMSLRTADPLTATGLVHRSLVTEAQNSRRVSINPRCMDTYGKKDMQDMVGLPPRCWNLYCH